MNDAQSVDERGSIPGEIVIRPNHGASGRVLTLPGRRPEVCEEGHGTGGSTGTQGTGTSEAAEQSTQGSDDSSRNDKYLYAALLLLVLVGLAVIVVVSIRFKTGKTTTTDEEPISENSWDLEDRLYDIKSVLLDTLSDPSKLFESGTPQAQALNWLVYEDKILNSTAHEDILQRYALIVFAYATNVELWRMKPQWHKLQAVQECSFPGIDCTENGKVNSINLGLTKLSGTLPEELGLLSDLTALLLPGNNLIGSIPETLYLMLTNLEVIDLAINPGLSATISSNIANLLALKAFQVSRTSLSGTLPPSLVQLSNLELVNLLGTSLHGPFFDLIVKLPKLQNFDASYTQFTGTVPAEIGNLTDLRQFQISHSLIDQGLPSEVWTLTNLESLVTQQAPNGRHVLPTVIGRLQRLGELVLSGYSGRIPSELGRLTMLTTLALDNGALSGEIPSEMGLLTSLTFLSFWDNDIEGSIPAELGNLAPNLTEFRIHENNLEGRLPQSFCESRARIRRDCIVECECCTSYHCVDHRPTGP